MKPCPFDFGAVNVHGHAHEWMVEQRIYFSARGTAAGVVKTSHTARFGKYRDGGVIARVE